MTSVNADRPHEWHRTTSTGYSDIFLFLNIFEIWEERMMFASVTTDNWNQIKVVQVRHQQEVTLICFTAKGQYISHNHVHAANRLYDLKFK